MENFNEMDMALEMMDAMEGLPADCFIAEYNKITGKNITKEQITWNEFPVYYDPED